MRSPYEMTALKRVERAASNAMKSPGARRRLLGRCLDTRRRSSRSCVVSPSVLRPSSRSACTTQLRIDCADGSNSSANSSGLLPTRTSCTICSLNSGGYSGLVLPPRTRFSQEIRCPPYGLSEVSVAHSPNYTGFGTSRPRLRSASNNRRGPSPRVAVNLLRRVDAGRAGLRVRSDNADSGPTNNHCLRTRENL